MDFPLSKKGSSSTDGACENSPGQARTDVELAEVDGNIYDTPGEVDRGEHNYSDAYVSATPNAGVALIPNAGTVLRSSDVTLSRRSAIILAVSGVIFSTLISIISGVVVYHITSGKSTCTQTDQEVNTRRELDALNRTLADVNQHLGALEQSQANTSSHMETLTAAQSTTTRQLEILGSVNQHLDTLEQSQANTSNHMETLTAAQSTTARQLEIIGRKLNRLGQQVAFSVNRLSTKLEFDGLPIFDGDRSINTGHYNMTSGEFTCPISGLYYFSFSFEINGIAQCYFLVNELQSQDAVYVEVRGAYEVASGSVIFHLSVNDVVRLHCKSWQYVLTGHRNAVFSGFLIIPDEL